MNLLPSLICAHLVGDFILQNDWMAANKSKNSIACLLHVVFYLAPFSLCFEIVGFHGWPARWLWIAIGVQHFLQDRFALHLKWMTFYDQTPSDKWPTGPLCVDQAWHIAFLWLFSSLV